MTPLDHTLTDEERVLAVLRWAFGNDPRKKVGFCLPDQLEREGLNNATHADAVVQALLEHYPDRAFKRVGYCFGFADGSSMLLAVRGNGLAWRTSN